MTRVAVTARSFRATPGPHLDALQASGFEVVTPEAPGPLSAPEMVALVQGCEGLICGVDDVTADVIAAGPLRAIVRVGAGLDNVDLAAAESLGCGVENTAGANARSVAELTIGLMIALARRIVEHHQEVSHGGWARHPGTELEGKRLGVVGLGAVGRLVVRSATCLGMEVVATDPFVEDADVPLLDLEEILGSCDVVTLHAPLTEQTKGLLDDERIGLMKQGALLINTARGEIVDEDALLQHLRNGHLGGAALDSFASEPPDPGRFRNVPNVILSPHAGAATTEATVRAGALAVERLVALLETQR